jgi:hypothetical protein
MHEMNAHRKQEDDAGSNGSYGDVGPQSAALGLQSDLRGLYA